jgi:Sulfotransferase domain
MSAAGLHSIGHAEHTSSEGLPSIARSETLATAWPRVKLYGERNTGTHYLARVMRANLQVRLFNNNEPRLLRRVARYPHAAEVVRDVYFWLTFRRNLGWKHMNPKSVDQLRQLGIDLDGLRFVMLVKNPYSWAVSMMRKPYHLGVDKVSGINELVTDRWPCTRRENMTTTAASLMDLWCTKGRSYLNLVSEVPSFLIRYEDLLLDPAASMARLASALGVEPRTDSFVNVAISAKRNGRAAGKTFESYRQYYLNEDWKASLTSAAISTINRQLDAELMRRLGYEFLPPDSTGNSPFG